MGRVGDETAFYGRTELSTKQNVKLFQGKCAAKKFENICDMIKEPKQL